VARAVAGTVAGTVARAVSGAVAGEEFVADRGPLEGVADAFTDVVPGPPAQQPLGPVNAGVGAGNVPWTPFGVTRLYRAVGDPVERVDEFPDGGARTGAEVDRGRRPGQGVEPGERGDVRRGQVPDGEVVPQA
jgi:hypothetical protein